MASSNAELKQVVLFLRNAAPEEFAAFVKRFEIYTDEVVYKTMDADAVSILAAQGRGQQCLAIMRIFHECEPPTPR